MAEGAVHGLRRGARPDTPGITAAAGGGCEMLGAIWSLAIMPGTVTSRVCAKDDCIEFKFPDAVCIGAAAVVAAAARP